MSDAVSLRPALASKPHEKPGTVMLIAAAVFMLIGVPMLYSAGYIGITTVNQLGRFLALAIVAIGADLVWGYTGILGLCQAMFFTIGGYAIGMYMALHGPLDGEGIPRCLYVVSSEVGEIHLPWFWYPFKMLLPAVLLGMIVPGIFALVFGFFMFRSRVRGVYFSIITQATTAALYLIFCMNNMKLCGTNGLTNFVNLAGFDLQSPGFRMALYVITSVVLVIAFVVCRLVIASRFGRLLLAIRDGESRLRFAGFQPVTFKVAIFVLGAVLAAVGGMLYTPQNGIITPAKMRIEESIFVVAWVAVGGRGTLSGAFVGTLVVNYLYSLLTSGFFYGLLPAGLKIANGAEPTGALAPVKKFLRVLLGADGWLFVLGAIFILVTLFFPDGIVGAWRKLLDGGYRRKSAAIKADVASSDAEEGRESNPRAVAAQTEVSP